MAKSLQQQLLDAGLVNKTKVKQTEQEKRKQARQQPKGQAARPPARRDAQQAQAEKAVRDRELNLKIQEEAARKALKAQLEQLIKPNRIETAGGGIDYRFVHRGVIKTIEVNPAQQAALVKGSLALVRYRAVYALVPKDIAAKVAERDAAAVVMLHDGTVEQTAEDQAYANYAVPDDLMW